MKIMIIGIPGSGKSTFSVRLHSKLNIPVYHLDKYFFESNWKERNYELFIHAQQELISQTEWIIDGNATKSFEMRYAESDICIYFNFPKSICYWRVFKRLFIKDIDIDDRANNCPERVRWSLLKYMWGYEIRVKKKLLGLRKKYPNVNFIEIHSDNEAKYLLNTLVDP